MGATPWYCRVEDVMDALDSKAAARSAGRIAASVAAATQSVEALTRRVFYPAVATKLFDWPTRFTTSSWDLWLDANELISVSSLSSGGVVIPAANYFLEPNQYGPPFDRISLNVSKTSAFAAGPTWQESISVTGTFGFDGATTAAGVLTSGVNSAATTYLLSDGSLVGIGDAVKLDSEFAVITGRQFVDSGDTLQGGGVAAQQSADAVTVVTGANFHVGEVLLVGTERMLVVDIAGNVLSVKRAWQGTTLALHAGSAPVYVNRSVTVERGCLGTAAASHSGSAVATRSVAPGLVRELALAEALNSYEQKVSGYVRTIGSGENTRNASMSALKDIRAQCYQAFGRQARTRAV